MKRSVGERLMRKHFDATFDGDGEILAAAKDVDRAIRREKAKAWDEGKIRGMDLMAEDSDGIAINPYRGRARR